MQNDISHLVLRSVSALNTNKIQTSSFHFSSQETQDSTITIAGKAEAILIILLPGGML